jgi:hypothetical protein
MIAYKFYILNSANLLIADNKHCIVGWTLCLDNF